MGSLLRLTPAGRALALLWFVSALFGAAHLRAQVPIYRLWAFTTTALVLAMAAARLARPALRAERRALSHTSAGEELVVDIVIENVSRRVARDVVVIERDLPATIERVTAPEQELVRRLGPGERVVVQVRLSCARRGSW